MALKLFCVFLVTEDKRSNMITKDASITLTAQEVPRVLGAVSQERDEDQICMRNTFWSSE